MREPGSESHVYTRGQVLLGIYDLVRSGQAVVRHLPTSEVWLLLASGEAFTLGHEGVSRIS